MISEALLASILAQQTTWKNLGFDALMIRERPSPVVTVGDNSIEAVQLLPINKAILKDALGNNVLDEIGLNSLNNFQSQSKTRDSGADVGTNSWFSSATELTVTLTRKAKVFVTGGGEVWGVGGTTSDLRLMAGSTTIQRALNIAAEPTITHISLSGIIELSKGTTTINFYHDGNTRSLGTQGISISYILLGS